MSGHGVSLSKLRGEAAMHIAVMGAGSVGGYFGGLLARAGNRVSLIARGAHLDAIRSHGLQVKSQWGDFTVMAEATQDPGDVGPVELVLFTVKTYQNRSAISALAPLLGEDTSVLTLQNGVDSFEELSRGVGRERVLPGAAYMETQVEAPGVIRQQGDVVRIVYGEVHGGRTDRAVRILETLRAAQIPAELSTDVLKELWTKFLFISTMAGVTGASRAAMSLLLRRRECRELLQGAMREVEAVARARGIALDTDVVDRTMAYMDAEVENLRASMHTDLELGRPLELEALNGALVRIGREVGVPTPINGVLYALLVPHMDGGPG